MKDGPAPASPRSPLDARAGAEERAEADTRIQRVAARLKETARALVSLVPHSSRHSSVPSPGVAPSWYEVEVLLRPRSAVGGRARWSVLCTDASARSPARFASRAAARRYARDTAAARCADYRLVASRVVQRVPAGTSEEEYAAVARYSRSAARAWPGTAAAFPDPDAAVGVAVGRAFVRGFRAGKAAARAPVSRGLEETPGRGHVPLRPDASGSSGETGRAGRDPDANTSRDSTNAKPSLPDGRAQVSACAREGSADPVTAPPTGRTPEEIAIRRYRSALSNVVSVPERRALYRVLCSWESRGRDPLSVAASAEGFLLWYITTADVPYIPSGTPPPADPGPHGPIGESALARFEELAAQVGAENGLLAVRAVVMELMNETYNFLGLWKYYQEAKRDAEEGV